MSRNTHVRDGELHQGTESAEFVVLGSAIGVLPAGTTLHDALVALDAELRRQESGALTIATFPANSIFLRSATANVLFDARIRVITTASATADATLRAAQGASATADAITLRAVLSTFSVDARLYDGPYLDIDAILLAVVSGSFTANAVIDAGGSEGFQSDAFQNDTFQEL